MRNPSVSIPASNHHSIGISVRTYREVKQDMLRYLKQSYSGEVSVYRERRGEWGEWFENWQLIDDKPKIIKEGWM